MCVRNLGSTRFQKSDTKHVQYSNLERRLRRLTAVFRLVVQNLQRESAHVQNFQFKVPTKSVRMRGFLSKFLDNQPKSTIYR